MVRIIFKGVLLVAAIPLLFACTGTRINSAHPLVKENYPASSVAKVYFLRPNSERSLGLADNKFVVELDRYKLMSMVKGEYTLAHLLPGSIWVTVTSDTAWGASQEIKSMSRSQEFEFEAGHTYYIVFTAIDGEFRGVYYEPQKINQVKARELVRFMHPVGIARKNPIDNM